jgi:hypothetical protein
MKQRFVELSDASDQATTFAAAYALRDEDDALADDTDGRAREARLAQHPDGVAVDREAAAQRARLALEAERDRANELLASLEAKLNVQQRRIYDYITGKLSARWDPEAEGNKSLLLHIQGWPGVGKSFVVQVLSQWVRVNAPNAHRARPLLTAYTGFASSHIGGITLHRALKLMTKDLATMQAAKRAALRTRLREAAFILIDEVSMIGAGLLFRAIKRIEDAIADAQGVGPKFNEDGFPPLILVGDFAQLPSVGDIPLYTTLKEFFSKHKPKGEKMTEGVAADVKTFTNYSAIVAERQAIAAANATKRAGRHKPLPELPQRRLPGLAKDAPTWSQQLVGLLQFSMFHCEKLTIQVRAADCEKQKKIVDYMVEHGRLPPGIFDKNSEYYISAIEEGAAAELIQRARFAPIATPTNARRRMFNFCQAMSFAQQQGVPLIFWQKRFDASVASTLEVERIEDPSSSYFDHFVAGAPAMVLTNVVPHLSISNGTQGKMHSLTWGDADETERNLERISKARPGELVEVDAPLFVNVVVTSRHMLPLPRVDPVTFAKLPDDAPAVADGTNTHYVFPMQLWDCREKRVGYKKSLLECPKCKSHMIELGFAFTYHKLQGATVDFMVLDLNFSSKIQCNFAAAYVGITRVRRNRDLALLPVDSAMVVGWLEKACWDVDLRSWLEKGERR